MTATNRPEFAAQLIALGEHLTEHPNLPEIYHVMARSEGGCQIRLLSGTGERGAQGLAGWARSLPGPVTSHAYRYVSGGGGHVDGHVLGALGGHVFEVVGTLPDDAVPAEPGRHEWTVTR